MQENTGTQNPSTGSGSGFHSSSSSSTAGGQGMTGAGGSGSQSGSHMGGTSTRSGNGGDGAVTDMLGDLVDDVPTTAQPQERTEGKLARMIETQTSKLPSDTFLWAAVGAMATSAVCELSGWNSKSRFFGQWVAPLLLFGVYNKLVKVQGHDQVHRG